MAGCRTATGFWLVLWAALMLAGPSFAQPVTAAPAEAAAAVLGRLDAAWDARDGARFAAEFTEDADVININGSHFQGRADLARQMQFIFNTRFKGGRHAERRLELARRLSPDLLLVVSSSAIAIPSAPQVRSRQTFLLQHGGGTWRIRHWHNTPLREAREGAPTRAGTEAAR